MGLGKERSQNVMPETKPSGGELQNGNSLRKLTCNRLKWSFLAYSETRCWKHKRWSEAPSPVRVEPEARAASSSVLIDSSPCSWTARPSLKQNLGSTSPHLPETPKEKVAL